MFLRLTFQYIKFCKLQHLGVLPTSDLFNGLNAIGTVHVCDVNLSAEHLVTSVVQVVNFVGGAGWITKTMRVGVTDNQDD